MCKGSQSTWLYIACISDYKTTLLRCGIILLCIHLGQLLPTPPCMIAGCQPHRAISKPVSSARRHSLEANDVWLIRQLSQLRVRPDKARASCSQPQRASCLLDHGHTNSCTELAFFSWIVHTRNSTFILSRSQQATERQKLLKAPAIAAFYSQK